MNRRQFVLGFILQQEHTALQVEVMELFSNPDGPCAFLVHHANEATRTLFAEWLRKNSGAGIICRPGNGTRFRGRIFRVSLCFGRGMILTASAPPIPIRPMDVLSVEFG
jgi:hypothetical protein